MEKQLIQRKQQIVQRWTKATMSSYPSSTVQFFNREKNQFSNPVGHSITSALEKLFDALLGPEPLKNSKSALDGIIRIRSVQDFTSSEAVAFVFALKTVVFEELKLKTADAETLREYLGFEARIDELGLHAFDTYMKCRDDLAEVRIKDIKRRSHLFMQNIQCPGMAAREEEEKVKPFDDSLKGEDAQ